MFYLKHKSIEWAREKRAKDDHILKGVEFKLTNLVDRDGCGFETSEAKDRLIKIEVDWNNILKDREES